ncbi:MAG: WG repeat-containing protein [Polyangiaceae bacterium]
MVRRKLSLVGLLLASCAPAPSPPAPPPVVATPPSPVAMTAVASQGPTPGPKEPPDYPLCVPQMYDEEPGQHGRFAFLDDATDRVGFRDAEGQVVIPPRFRHAYAFSREGMAAVIDEDGPAFIRIDGSTIARAFFYDNGPDYLTEDRVRIVDAAARVGFIDGQGHEVVAPRYDYASSFCHGRAAVCRGCVREEGEHAEVHGGRWGFIDRQGREVVGLRYDGVIERYDESGVAVVERAGQRLRIDRDGRPIAP